jgi:hypothetical protein
MWPETTGEQKQYLAWHMIRESSVHNGKEEEVRTQQQQQQKWMNHCDSWF